MLRFSLLFTWLIYNWTTESIKGWVCITPNGKLAQVATLSLSVFTLLTKLYVLTRTGFFTDCFGIDASLGSTNKAVVYVYLYYFIIS
jgi:hypothetical protein